MPKPVSQIVTSGRSLGESSQAAQDAGSRAWDKSEVPDKNSARKSGTVYVVGDKAGVQTFYPVKHADAGDWIPFDNRKDAEAANDMKVEEARRFSDEQAAGEEGKKGSEAVAEVSDRMPRKSEPKYRGTRR